MKSIRNLVLLASVLVMAACADSFVVEEDDIGNSLVVRAELTGSFDLEGTTWLEPCKPDGAIWRDAVLTFGNPGSRTETDYSDAACTTIIAPDTFDVSMTVDGDQPNMSWVDNTGTPTIPPPRACPDHHRLQGHAFWYEFSIPYGALCERFSESGPPPLR